jgi:hypothetical protein
LVAQFESATPEKLSREVPHGVPSSKDFVSLFVRNFNVNNFNLQVFKKNLLTQRGSGRDFFGKFSWCCAKPGSEQCSS